MFPGNKTHWQAAANSVKFTPVGSRASSAPDGRRMRSSIGLAAVVGGTFAAWLPLAAEEPPAPAGPPPSSPASAAPAPPAEPGAFGAGVTYFPIPAISTNKNEGTTYGLLNAFLIADDRGDIDTVLAANLGYRDAVLFNAFVDYRYNPSLNSFFEVFAYKAARVEGETQVLYEDRKSFGGRWGLRAELHEERTATDRFFGRGDKTSSLAESALTSNEYSASLQFGPYLAERLLLQGTARVRSFRVGRSLVEDVPDMLDAFPNERGIEGGIVTGEGLSLTYDTRDSAATPTRGEFVNGFAELAHLFDDGPSTPFWRFGFDVRKLWPMGQEGQFVTAARVKMQFVTGTDVPFWELSSIGGSRTLRSNFNDRFTNKHMLLFNVEERMRVWQVTLFGVTGDVQVAPFFDLGKVFDSPDDDLLERHFASGFNYSWGVGFRGVVRPYIVGRVDVGFGPEGSATTVTLDYPF